MIDSKIKKILKQEQTRQTKTIELIASENFVSKDIMALQGSIFTNKYAEGYPGKRYYGGCDNVDSIELLAQQYACELFKCSYANVQPHSGSQANQAVYMALLDPGDSIVGMSLDAGGHLTHGYRLSSSGKLYQSTSYGLDENDLINYVDLEKLVLEIKPKLIIAGASAYSRTIDFKRFREIADSVGAYLMVDMAHIAGLVATGKHPSPFPYAHVVTSTTHKTLRGPRGGLILTNDEELFMKINKAVFPGIQGGPLMHVIAAKAQCFYEALQPEFTEYINKVVQNSSEMANEFISLGSKIISRGTDNHMFILDVKSSYGLTGLQAEKYLETFGITVNKNTIPNDTERPMMASGIRIGTPAITTRGLTQDDCKMLAQIISHLLTNINSEVSSEVLEKLEYLKTKQLKL